MDSTSVQLVIICSATFCFLKNICSYNSQMREHDVFYSSFVSHVRNYQKSIKSGTSTYIDFLYRIMNIYALYSISFSSLLPWSIVGIPSGHAIQFFPCYVLA